MKKTRKASRPLKAHVHMAPSPASAPDLSHLGVNHPNNGFSGTESLEIEKKSARNDVTSTHARAERDPATGCLLLRPGQPHIGSKLDDQLEERICQYVSEGMTWTESARLCDIDRVTVHRWKQRGIDEPGSRYSLFLERIEKAELFCKQVWINRVAKDPDWRALAFLLKSHWPAQFTEHVRQEIGGIDGAPVAMNVSSTGFNVIFQMPEDPKTEYKIIDHRQPAEVEVERKQPTQPQPLVMPNGHVVSTPIAPPEEKGEKLSKLDPLGNRMWERGLHS